MKAISDALPAPASQHAVIKVKQGKDTKGRGAVDNGSMKTQGCSHVTVTQPLLLGFTFVN